MGLFRSVLMITALSFKLETVFGKFQGNTRENNETSGTYG